MKQAHILKVVVASPADVQAERGALSSIVDELNRGVAASKGLRLELLRWETDSHPGFHIDGPQGLIDEVLNIKESDLLIGIFWKRFGTSVKDAGSGTEHEFFNAYDSWRGKGSPQIMFYFNQKPFMPSSSEEAEQVKSVLDFKKKFPSEGLFWTYKGKAQFERKVREHLIKWILDYKPTEPPQEETSKATPRTDEELKKIYADELKKHVSKVKFLGEDKSRELKDVFVELTIVEEYERPFRDAEFLSFMDSDRRRRYKLFDDEDREDPKNRERVKEKRIVKPDELLRPNRKAIVTGAPGCGKTTLLKYLANKILEEEKRLPVFLELKTVTKDDLNNANKDLAELLFNKTVVKNLHLGKEQNEQLKKIFLEELKSNNAAIFLDGFDEVRDGNLFTELCQSIHSFVRSDFGQNLLIVSTRPYALNRIALDLEQMEIAPLNQRQIEAFLNAYYQTDGACKKLLGELKKPNPLSEMVRVPILLSGIVELYRQQQTIEADASRTDIYQKITKRLIARLDQDKSVQRYVFRITDTEGTLKLDFLKHLAFERLITDEPEETGERREVSRLIFTDDVILQKAKEYVRRENLQGINATDLADDVKGTALLREIGDDSYAFAHLTIHEYLAATILAKHAECEKLFSRAYFNPSIVEMEVLPMTLGLANNAEPFYKSLEQLSESLTFTNFRLQLRGLVYGAKISDERRDKIIDRVLDFIAERIPEESAYRVPVVRSLIGIKGQHAEPVIKRIASLLEDKNSYVRERAADALGEIGNEKAVDELILALSDEDRSVRWRAASALGEIGNEKAVDALILALSDEYSYVRERAAEALGKIGNEKAVDALILALSDEYSDVRGRAADALGKLGNEKAVDAFILALSDEDSYVRGSAADALGEIGNEKAVDDLILALSDEDSYVRGRAALALGKIGNEKAVDELILALSDKDRDVRERAASALGKIGNEKAVDELILALSDKDIFVRGRAAEALGKIGNEKAVDELILALSDKDIFVRERAAEALGKIGNEKAVDALILALSSEYRSVRWRAALALGELGNEKAVDELILALSDEDSSVRLSAAEALGKIGNEKAVDALILALSSEYSDVRWSAAKALGSIKENILSKGATQSLTNKDSFARRKAAQVVGYYSLEPRVLEELSNIAATDAVTETRAAAADAKEKFERKLALFNVPFSEISEAAENAGREQALEDTRSFIAHEVRHALLPLDMATKLLSEELSKSNINRKTVNEYVEIILEQTKAGFDVVSQLQEYSKTLTPNKQPTDINALLKQSIEEKRLDCEQNNIKVIEKFGRLPKIEIDAEMIKAVLRNIIDNSLESMEQDGTLTLLTSQNQKQVVIEISDTGKGIEPKNLRRVFELGFTTKLGKKGAGIGMALSRRYIEQAHKGHIAIVNNTGDTSGATVKIILPLTERNNNNGN